MTPNTLRGSTPWAKAPDPVTPNRKQRRRIPRWVAIPAAITVFGLGGLAFAAGWGSQVLNGSQSTQAGGPTDVTISSPTAGAVVSGNTVTFAAQANEAPSFVGASDEIDYTNNGPNAAYVDAGAFVISAVPTGANGLALQNELSLDYGSSTPPTCHDGLLSAAIGAGSFPEASIAPGATLRTTFQVYAGPVQSDCAIETAAPLTEAAAYGIDVVSVTTTFSGS